MEDFECRYYRNSEIKKRSKAQILSTIKFSINRISSLNLDLLRKVYCPKYEEESDIIENKIHQLMKKQDNLYSLFSELEKEMREFPSIFEMDSKDNQQLYRLLYLKAELKMSIIMSGESKESLRAEIEKLDVEKAKLIARQ